MSVEINAIKRDKIGKEANKQYKREGKIPCILYGQGTNINLLINNDEFEKLRSLITKSTIIDLKLDGKKYDVLIKDYDKDHIKNKFIHIDFYELKAGKSVHVKIPLKFIGNPIGVREGGILEKHLVELEIECLPNDIISNFEINIENIPMNGSLHVKEVTFDSKYKILTHPDEVLVHVSGKIKEEVEEKPVAEAVTEEVVEGEVKTEEVKEDEKKEKKE